DWIDTSVKDVKAAVFRSSDGVLVLPMWIGGGAQFVPGQASAGPLSINVPGVPITATAWGVSPGRVQALQVQGEVGGTKGRLPNFSMTAAVLFTSSLTPTGLVVPLQDQQRRLGRLAGQWLHDQAREELSKVEKVHASLERVGHPIPDGEALLRRAREALQECMQHRRDGEHTQAYEQAEVTLRALRLYMRSHWEPADRALATPVASPYRVAFYTLPKHWQLLDEMKAMRPAQTILPGGDFETEPRKEQAGWLVQEVPTLDEVAVAVRRVEDNPHGGRQCLMMRVLPRDVQRIPGALERTYVALHTPAVKPPPGTLVRLSVWGRIME